MAILTEQIGSIPRPASLLQAMASFQAGAISHAQLDEAYGDALRDTIARLEQTGSLVVTDGEQTKPSFATYPLSGLSNLASDGVVIPFADGHTRQLPRLTAAPFRYGVHVASYVEAARRYTQLPIKQAVISASARALLNPQEQGERRPAGIYPAIGGHQTNARLIEAGGLPGLEARPGAPAPRARLRAFALLLALSTPNHPADRSSGRNAYQECRCNCFGRMALYALFCVVIKLRSNAAALFCNPPRCPYAILKGIRDGRCRPRSLARCFVNLLVHLFQH